MLFEEMRDAGMVEAVDPDAQDFYVLTQEEQYREDTGSGIGRNDDGLILQEMEVAVHDGKVYRYSCKLMKITIISIHRIYLTLKV